MQTQCDKHQTSVPARPGLALAKSFCRWHQAMIERRVFARCCESACPVVTAQETGSDPSDPAQILIAPDISLTDLINAVGSPNWSLLQNSASSISTALNQLARPLAEHDRWLDVTDSAGNLALTCPSAGMPLMEKACELLIEPLLPLVNFVGFSAEQSRQALQSLLKGMKPGSAGEGLALFVLLRAYFYALGCLRQIRPGQQDTEHNPQIRLERDFMQLEQALMALSSAAGHVESLERLRARRTTQGQGANYTPELDATATSDLDSAMLLIGALVSALNILPSQDAVCGGVLELLGHVPASDTLEALLRIELIVCGFFLAWLCWPRNNLREELETQRKALVSKASHLEKQLAKSLAWWTSRT